MDNPTPSGPGNLAAPLSPGITSHTLYPGEGGEVDYDQTIKFKTPGTGMTVFSRYKLERVLGRGGMGVVWLADDLKLERPVALKFLPSLIGLDPAAVKELKTETRRGLELSHPHIVRIYDFVDDEDAAAISMEFVDGKTLSELRLSTNTGVFSVDEVSKWLLGVCDALDYAHFQRKLIHRDLKPANIMLTTKDAVAKIADFGIARSLSDTMSRLSAAHIGTSGTLPYMSPQQAMGERPQPTDDVYSLGATIYELLTGKPPFYRGDLPTQINSKIPPSVHERRQELEAQAKDTVPKAWEEAIASCLHKEASLRPSCAGALAEMLGLKPITVTVRTGAYAAAAARSAAAQSSGNKTPLIAAAFAVIVGAGAAGWYFTQESAQKSSSPSQAPQIASAPEEKPHPNFEPPASGETKGSEEPGKPKEPASQPAESPAQTPSKPGEEMVVKNEPSPAAVPSTGTMPASTAPGAASPEASGTAAPNAVVTGAMPASSPGPVPSPELPPAGAASPGTPSIPVTFPPQAVASMPPGSGLSLTPDPSAATSGALAALTPTTPPPPLPPGVVIPQGGLVLTQPNVPAPVDGFWTVEQIFPVPPHATYSPKGKRYLLYKTQAALKEKGLYSSTVDGEEGKNTHNAIVLFQVRNGLEPNGLLDLLTLAALQLSAEPDKADWNPPSGSSSGGGSRKRTAPKEEPGFFQKTGDTFKKLFK